MVSSSAQAVAGIPLLETKRYIPRWRPGLVSRPRLIERLDRGKARKLTLVSAPAGFGKTTLLAEWLATTPAGDRPAGWVSLDQTDNDPALFWAYVITALQRVRSEIGKSALALLHSPQPPPIESVLTILINEIHAIEDDLALVLDDFHVIDAQAVHGALAFLLDHLPPRMHLVIASRSAPPLPLARLRARGESTELQASDLRFTPDEAAAFLNEVMGLNLSAADVAALEQLTEGWIAGLQLAALSMQRRGDVSGFVQAFAGDDRYIVDYLVEEVLQHQPERVRSFLLQTSLILDRFSDALCDAVTGRTDGAEILATLDRGNLFLVPLDDKRRWYRYHHLFADVLRTHSVAEQPDQVPLRHRRASQWYEQNGLRSDAIRHAFAAKDFERAAGLVELAAMAMLGSSQQATLHGWLTALPDEVVRARPVLSVYHAFATFGFGDLETVATRLQDAERWLDPTAPETSERRDAPAGERVVSDMVGFRSLPGMIAIARAYHAGASGDVPGTVSYARRALEVLPEDDQFWRGAGNALLGIAYWNMGDLEEAHRSFSEGMARLQMAEVPDTLRYVISCAYILADIRIAQSRLREAESTYERALQLSMEQDEPVWGTSDLYVGLSELRLERDDLDASTRYLHSSKELGEHSGLPETRHRWYVANARIKEAQGDLDGALALLDEAERLFLESPDPNVRPVSALKTRVWVAQGRLAEALDWVRVRNLTVDDDLSFVREFEHLTLVRVLIARCRSERDQRSIQEAVALLDRLLKAADDGERAGSVIEILLTQALAYEAQGNIRRALASLQRALTLAEPEEYVRVFVAEGEPMRNLLRQAAAAATATPYTRRLLSAFDNPAHPASAPAAVASAGLAEPLTAREVEVLRLIAAGLRNQEIADQLFIGLPTLKRHIANAYGKLGVRHRTEAIARAGELNLL